MHYFNRRLRHILNTHPLSTLNDEENDDEQGNTRSNIMLKDDKSVLFEHFKFHRILLDESHEYFGYSLENNSAAQYLKLWVEHLKSDFKLYISGTPVINSECLYNILDFLDCRIKVENGTDHHQICSSRANQM